MAGAFVQSNSGDPTPAITTPLAFTGNVTSGNLLIVAFLTTNTSVPSSVTDTIGTTYVQIASKVVSAFCGAYIYAGLAPSSGANTATVNWASSCDNPNIEVYEFSGMTATLDGTPVSATATGTAMTSGNLTTTNPTDLLFGYVIPALFTNSGEAGWNTSIDAGSGCLTEYLFTTTTGTNAATGTASGSGQYVGMLAAFKQSGASFNALAGSAAGKAANAGHLSPILLGSSTGKANNSATLSGTNHLAGSAIGSASNRASMAGQATPTMVQHLSASANNDVTGSSGGTGNAGSPFKYNLPNTTQAGNCLIFRVSNPYSSGRTITITDNKSNTWSLVKTVNNGSMMDSVYAAYNVASGTQNITVTFDTRLYAVRADITEWYNIVSSSPVDVSSSATPTGTTVSSALTTTLSGDLIYHCGTDTANTLLTQNISGMTAGSGFAFLTADVMQGAFVQYQVQSAAGAITPSVTISGVSDQWNTISIAFKAGPQGSAAPAGIRIVHIHHVNYWHAGSIIVPSSGNLLYISSAYGTGNLVIGVTNASGNTWHELQTTGDGNGPPQCFYAPNATTAHNQPLTVTGATSLTNQISMIIYDIAGAATSPFDSSNATSPNGSGDDWTAPGPGNFSLGTITPSTANGLVIATMATYLGVITAETVSGHVFDAVTYTNEIDYDLCDNADGYAHYYNPNISPVNFGWTLGGAGFSGPSGETIQVVAFKAANVTPPNNGTLIQSALNTVSGSGVTTSTTAPFSGANTAGNTIIVSIGWDSATGSVTSVTDTAGNAYVLGLLTQGAGVSNAIYYCSDIAAASAGSNSVKATLNASETGLDVRAMEYSGLAVSSALDGPGSGASGSGTVLASGNFTTTNANDMLFGTGYCSGDFTTGGSGWTVDVSNGNYVEHLNVNTTSTTNNAGANQTPTGGWVAQGLAFKLASSGVPILAGHISGKPANQGTLSVQKKIGGTASGKSSNTGNATITGELFASSSGRAANSGTLGIPKNLVGTSYGKPENSGGLSVLSSGTIWISNGQASGGSGPYSPGTQGVAYILANFASPGDTITLPSGSFNWGGITLTVSIPIIIMGANGNPPTGPTGFGTGTVNTTITGGLISVNTSSSGKVRISGFKMVGDGTETTFFSVNGSSDESDSDGIYRVDNMEFNNGTAQSIMVGISGNGPGLIDHCKLSAGSGSEMIHNYGTTIVNDAHPNTGSVGDGWFVNVTPGSNQALYVENCVFDNVGTAAVASGIQSYYGARTVLRYNQWTFCGPDFHGGVNNGARWFEIYNNAFIVPAGLSFANPGPGVFRAGSGMYFNNTQSVGSGASGTAVEIWSDNGSGTNDNTNLFYGPCMGIATSASDTAQNPSPIYIWGNDGVTQPMPPNTGDYTPNTNIALNTQFFVSATQPTNMTVWQTSSGVINNYPYVPYTYPHPLVQAAQPSNALSGNAKGTSANHATTLTVTRALKATNSGKSANTGHLIETNILVLTIRGRAAGSATLSVGGGSNPLASTVAGVSSNTATLSVKNPLACTVHGSAANSGTLLVQRKLAVHVTGSASNSGVLAATKPLASTVSGKSANSGHLIETNSLGSSVSGHPANSAHIAVTRALSSSVTGRAANTANLFVGGSTVHLSGTVAGRAANTGNFRVTKPLAASGLGRAANGGNISPTHLLASTVTGRGSAAGNITVRRALFVNAFGSASNIANITDRRSLSGSAKGFAGNVGNLSSPPAISGSSIGKSANQGEIRVGKTLLSIIVGHADNAGSLHVGAPTIHLISTCAGKGSASAIITVTQALSSRCFAQASNTGILGSSNPLSGLAFGVSDSVGRLKVGAFIPPGQGMSMLAAPNYLKATITT